MTDDADRSTAPADHPPPPVRRGNAGPAGHRRHGSTTPTSTTPPARPRSRRSPRVADDAAAGTRACTAARATSRRSARRCSSAPGSASASSSAPAQDDDVIFTRNTTDALNLLASCRARRRSCASTSSTTRTCCPGAPGRTAGARGRHRRADARRPGRARCAPTPTALLAVTGASNVTGEVCRSTGSPRSRTPGARIAVDAAQLAPHRRVDLAATGVDYLALSGHKLYAPFGAGVLVGRRDWLDAAAPYLAGGGAVHAGRPRRRRDSGHRSRPARGGHAQRARRRGAGRGLQDARAVLDAPARPTSGAARPARRRAWPRSPASAAAVWPDSPDRVAVLSFTVAGHSAGHVAAYLSAEHGIGVRDGRFCAHPLLRAPLPELRAPTATDRGAREHRARHHRRARRPAGRRAARAGRPRGALDLRRRSAAAGPRRRTRATLDPLGVGRPGATGTGCANPACCNSTVPVRQREPGPAGPGRSPATFGRVAGADRVALPRRRVVLLRGRGSAAAHGCRRSDGG